MNKYALDLKKYAEVARQAAAEGCVLLNNDNQTLPIRKGDRVAVFGRIAFDYYYCGLGSGGLVNTRYVVGIVDALKEVKESLGISLDENLIATYEAWIKENPFDHGSGWGKVPWSQQEMDLDDTLVEASKEADIALVIVGRTAGEDQDTKLEAGSYLLTDTEKSMIAKVTSQFERVAIILNVGNIIDMSWAKDINPPAIMYVWQGGQEGGHGVVDVLTGAVNPCGKLTDTIAHSIEDYPSTSNFGSLDENFYVEDIYVGYRYFETFAKNKVLYPFGYGLSYTTFAVEGSLVYQPFEEEKTDIVRRVIVDVKVKNTGGVPGKEVIQVYLQAPQGLLGKPSRSLVAFAKTKVLQPEEEETLHIHVPISYMASYDDSNVTGNKSSFILEAGDYSFYVGSDVRKANFSGNFVLENLVCVEALSEAYAPVQSFERMKPVKNTLLNSQANTQANSQSNSRLNTTEEYAVTFETVPTRTVSPKERLVSQRTKDIEYTGDKGFKLGDVYTGKVAMDTFIAQLCDEDLIHMFRGEGMCSPKVTPGTAAAFGGLTPSLRGFGIPAACCADGPSGIRMDCGTKAFSLANGTALGCTFNYELVEELFKFVGLELRKNKIDTLLGPGMNIHRNPLNGRNFEYISEDPIVTGKLSAAQVAGMSYAGVTGTVKHFTANNQEAGRRSSDSIISERALREIYLKGFEIAIKEGGAGSVMTTYGAVNGLWTAGSYDLCTVILRNQWGFDGVVMTDWWAEANIEGEKSTRQNKASMVAAQNDVYMCVTNSVLNPEKDNLEEALTSGDITRGDLQRNVANILSFIMRSPAMLWELELIDEEEIEALMVVEVDDVNAYELSYYSADPQTNNPIVVDGSKFNTHIGSSVVFGINLKKFGKYAIELNMKSDLGTLAQLPVTVYINNHYKGIVSIQGTEGKWITERLELGLVFGENNYIKLYFGASGLDIATVTILLLEEMKRPF